MQRNVPFILCLILIQGLAGCSSQSRPATAPEHAEVPAWYGQQSLKPTGYWVGYGDAPTLEAAKTLARADLSSTLSSQIRSQTRIKTRTGTDAERSKEVEQQIEEISQTRLSDLTTLRSDQQQGRYYVSLGYDRRPLLQRLLEILPDTPTTERPQLLHSSALFQQIQTHTGKIPALQIHHQQHRYLISHGNSSVVVRNSELPLLFPQQQSSQLQINLQPQQVIYPPESLFHLQIQTQDSGYLSYLQIFADGATILNLSNQLVATNATIHYPDPERYDGLISEMPVGKSSTQVLHLIMRCQQPADLSLFEAISIQKGQEYQSYRLGDLDRVTRGCEITTRQQRIRR